MRRSILTDPNLPGFTPYNIQLLSDGRLYVTFENKTNPNVGAVEILNSNGTFQPLIPSTDTHLKEPWGLALAPSTFGPFGGDLLVGNKCDGTINAFNPTTGAFVGTLTDASGNPIADPGLWGLAFRQTGSGFDPNTLYFAAGVGFPGRPGQRYLRPRPLRLNLVCPGACLGDPPWPGDDRPLRRLPLGVAPASAGLRTGKRRGNPRSVTRRRGISCRDPARIADRNSDFRLMS